MESERAQNRQHLKFKIDNSRFNSYDKNMQGAVTISNRDKSKLNYYD